MPIPQVGWGRALRLAGGQTDADQEQEPGVAGPYWLHARLGVGGQGTAYLATGDPAGRTAVCVVKRFHQHDADTLRRVQRSLEAQLDAVDRSPTRPWPMTPCVPEVLSYDLTPSGQPWIAYEYCGPALDTYLRRHPLSRPDRGPTGQRETGGPRLRRLELLRRLAVAVHQLHEGDVVHRDLKPANILVEPRGYRASVRLCDLDLARRGDQTTLTADGQGLGTLAYSAPEQLAGHRVGTEADVYSIGATALFLATGEHSPPLWFRTRDLRSLADHVRDNLGPDVADWVDRALAIDPTQRPPLRDLLDVTLPLGGEVGRREAGRPARSHPDRPAPPPPG